MRPRPLHPCILQLPSSVLALLLLTLPALAQPLTDRLPASTLVYVGWSPNASLQATAPAKMLADERFVAPWRTLFQEFALDLPDRRAGANLDQVGQHLAPLLADAVQCEGAFALLELKSSGKRSNPQSVLMLDLGARKKSFEEHFKPVHLRLRDRAGDKLQMMKLEGSWVYFRPDRAGKPALTWGFVGDTFVLFFGETAEDFIPKLVKGKPDKPLKAHPAFADAVAKIPGESVFTTYLDARAATNILKRIAEREAADNNDLRPLLGKWDKILDEIGAANVTAVAEKTAVEDKQFVTRTLVRTEGAPKGLLALLGQKSVDPAMLKTVPADAMAALAFRLDLAKSYDQIKASVLNVGGNDAKEAFTQLEQGAQGLGIPLNDTLQALGDQWVIYNAQSQGGLAFTGWTLVVDVRDADKFAKSLDVLRGMLVQAAGGAGAGGGGTRLRSHVADDGTKIEFVQLGRWTVFAPAWAVVGDKAGGQKLVVALYPQHVEEAVRHMKLAAAGDPAAKTLLDNPDYVAARKRTGDDGPVVYVSGPKVVDNLYPIGLVLVNLIASFDGWADRDEHGRDHPTAADLLPPPSRLLSYVGHDALAVKLTPDGLLKTRTVANPILSPLAWVDSPVLWLALGIPALDSVEEQADRDKSVANLFQISNALNTHATQNNGKYPADLQTLIKNNALQETALKSPYGPAKNGPDYVYLSFAGISQQNTGDDVIIAYDAAALEQRVEVPVLYGNGRTDSFEPENFKAALEESKKKAQLKNAAP